MSVVWALMALSMVPYEWLLSLTLAVVHIFCTDIYHKSTSTIDLCNLILNSFYSCHCSLLTVIVHVSCHVMSPTNLLHSFVIRHVRTPNFQSLEFHAAPDGSTRLLDQIYHQYQTIMYLWDTLIYQTMI